MDLDWSDADRAFQDEVRAFLDAELTPDLRRRGKGMTSVYADHDTTLAWQAKLHARGWVATGLAHPLWRSGAGMWSSAISGRGKPPGQGRRPCRPWGLACAGRS